MGSQFRGNNWTNKHFDNCANIWRQLLAAQPIRCQGTNCRRTIGLAFPQFCFGQLMSVSLLPPVDEIPQDNGIGNIAFHGGYLTLKNPNKYSSVSLSWNSTILALMVCKHTQSVFLLEPVCLWQRKWCNFNFKCASSRCRLHVVPHGGQICNQCQYSTIVWSIHCGYCRYYHCSYCSTKRRQRKRRKLVQTKLHPHIPSDTLVTGMCIKAKVDTITMWSY